MSSPHFYQAEERFVQAVFGMKPNKQQHQTTIDINPVGNPEPALTSPAFVLSAPGVAGGKTVCLPLGGAVFYNSEPALMAEVPGTVL